AEAGIAGRLVFLQQLQLADEQFAAVLQELTDVLADQLFALPPKCFQTRGVRIDYAAVFVQEYHSDFWTASRSHTDAKSNFGSILKHLSRNEQHPIAAVRILLIGAIAALLEHQGKEFCRKAPKSYRDL